MPFLGNMYTCLNAVYTVYPFGPSHVALTATRNLPLNVASTGSGRNLVPNIKINVKFK